MAPYLPIAASHVALALDQPSASKEGDQRSHLRWDEMDRLGGSPTGSSDRAPRVGNHLAYATTHATAWDGARRVVEARVAVAALAVAVARLGDCCGRAVASAPAVYAPPVIWPDRSGAVKSHKRR